MIHQLDTRAADFDARLTALLAHDPGQDESIERTVADILRAVRQRGDEAVLEYTRRFDRLDVGDARALELPAADLQAALAGLPAEQREALEAAAQRVRAYHEHQRAQSWSYTEADGTRLGQKITGLDRVGLYVPGGKAAYPSSVLMNALPAKVAGVGELIMVVPTPDGVRNAMVLAAACIAGVDRVFTIGGAQAVGALAYGTATVPAVDKIVGPGNAWVAEAKRRVFGTVGIDMIAGPSEILVLCDGHADPDWIAMDLFSQAEHDELAQAILLSPDADFLARVRESIARLLPQMPRQAVIARSLADRGALILVRSLDEACELVDRIAPEHLEIATRDPQHWAERIRHAGAMFLGPYSSESLGDYCAGPNHVLPTMRTARFSSPLGVYDFQKRTSIIEVSAAGAQTLGRIASVLAHSEGFQAHARSAEFRLDPP
ncbi:MAG: histidinol dehydrogenase [Burkholderiaceae bacterium]|nr:histidinol dehydrogenase [Burkholderiaceae bacterium]